MPSCRCTSIFRVSGKEKWADSFGVLFRDCLPLESSLTGDRSVYVSCADSSVEGEDFLTSTWRVRCVFFTVSLVKLDSITYLRDTLEQIDVAKGLIEKYPDVRLVSVRLSNQDLESVSDIQLCTWLGGYQAVHQAGQDCQLAWRRGVGLSPFSLLESLISFIADTN